MGNFDVVVVDLADDPWAVDVAEGGQRVPDVDGHDGRPAPGASGFRKRELYLDEAFFPSGLTGAAVDHTTISDPPLRAALSRLHDRLLRDTGSLDAEARLALIGERVTDHLTGGPRRAAAPEPAIAMQLRQLLDDHMTSQASLAWAAATLDRSVPHLVRSFTRQFGVSPHAYLIGRRIDAARRLLLCGTAPTEVAMALGFYDQAHLTRHFKKHTSTTPIAYAHSHTRPATA
jgi:AraC-like DNA-binding protein